MEPEVQSRLLAQLAKQEKLLEFLLAKIDNLDTEQSCWEVWRDQFIMPAILLLAGHGYQSQLAELLATTDVEMGKLEEMPALQRQLSELRGWRRAVGKIPPWTGLVRDDPYPD